MKTALLCLLILSGCATVPDMRCEAGGGCLTMLKTHIIQAMQKAWDDGWAKGYDKGEDNAPPVCKRTI